MLAKFLSVWLLLCSVALGQIDIKSATYYQISGLGKVVTIGDMTLVPAIPKIESKPIGVVSVETQSAEPEVNFTDQQRLAYPAKKVTDKNWLIEAPGKYWVEVKEYGDVKLADGTTRRIMLDSKTAVVEFNFEPGPGPEPPTPPPSPVPNEYGVGSVAYQYAPKDAANAAKMSSIYKQSGDFLFGIPSLKFIVSSNEAHSKDPSRSVIAWINQQYDSVQCPDLATCRQWTLWKQKVSEALVESQKNRQFTRQDWFNALNEISKAVGTQK